MNEFKEPYSEKINETQKPDINEAERPKIPEHNSEGKDVLPDPDTSVFDKILRALGLISEPSSDNQGEGKSDSSDGERDYSAYLEQGEDGKYYDKETEKAYDSIEQWEKAQEALAKRYEDTAKYYKDKAQTEWKSFKNATENGETDVEKWKHYRVCREYYEKVTACNEKANSIREMLGQNTNDGENGKDNREMTLSDISGWIKEINPKYDPFDTESPYANNCGSCAYAVFSRLNGNKEICATDKNIPYNHQMTELTGMEQVPMSAEEIKQRLLEAGNGAHAIIGIDRAKGPGHWFNAACIDGKVVAIDGQTGEINDWPPDYGDVVNWEMSIKKGEL